MNGADRENDHAVRAKLVRQGIAGLYRPVGVGGHANRLGHGGLPVCCWLVVLARLVPLASYPPAVAGSTIERRMRPIVTGDRSMGTPAVVRALAASGFAKARGAIGNARGFYRDLAERVA